MSEPEKHPPSHWEQVTGIRIYDDDGWRGVMRKDFSEPITLDEFNYRMQHSTTMGIIRIPLKSLHPSETS